MGWRMVKPPILTSASVSYSFYLIYYAVCCGSSEVSSFLLKQSLDEVLAPIR